MIEFNATILVAMLSFVVFIMIMNAIFYRPMLNIMRKREDYINSNYEAAKAFSEKANEYDNERSSKLQQTQDKCRGEIRSVVQEAQSEANNLMHDAREQSKAEILSRKEVLFKEEQKLEDTVKATVIKDLAASITSKLIGESSAVVRK